MSVAAWQRRLYPDERTRSPVPEFLEHVVATTQPHMDVLEIGAGAGEINAHRIRGTVHRIVGLDLSPRVLHNPLVDEAVVGDALEQPFDDASFDLAFALYVLEHIREPDRFCREVARVLRPGGWLLALTPNLCHYVSLVSRCSPHRVHEWVGRRRGYHEDDVIPTYYRLNSRGTLRRHLSESGFTEVLFTMKEVQPNYLTWNTPTFLAGAAYERLVNSTDALAGARVNILLKAKK